MVWFWNLFKSWQTRSTGTFETHQGQKNACDQQIEAKLLVHFLVPSRLERKAGGYAWTKDLFMAKRWVSNLEKYIEIQSRVIVILGNQQTNAKKNKMKPTNPNADTYVEKQRFNTCLSQFPANPLVEHPDLTHWGDTLVAHPCLTLLRYTLVRHSCLTLLLVRHFLLDSLTCHSCKTLLLNTLVRHFLLDTSYLALLTWHSSGALLLDTLVRHSCWTDTFLRHSYMTL